ncbi:MAG: MFS transporter [Promethearchaeota archaeon]
MANSGILLVAFKAVQGVGGALIAGAILFGAWLAALIVGLTLGNRLGWDSSWVLGALGFAAAGAVLFVLAETRVDDPVIDPKVWRENRAFTAANVGALLNYLATNGVNFLLSIYLQRFLGLPPVTAGLLLLPSPLLMSLLSPLAGRLSDRVGPRVMASLGLVVTASGLALLAVVLNFLPVAYLLASQAVVGVGNGLFSSPNKSAIMGSVGKGDLGMASGVFSTMRVVGQSFSVALLGAIVAAVVSPQVMSGVLATHQVAADLESQRLFVRGFTTAILVSVGLWLAGVVTSLLRGSRGPVGA